MYQLLADVLPYLLFFYLLDSFVAVGRHDLLFVAHGREFGLKGEGFQAAGFTPLSEVLLAWDLPVVISSQGLYRLRRDVGHEPSLLEADDLEFFSFEDLGAVTVEHTKVRAGYRLLARLATPAASRELARLLNRLRAEEAGVRLASLATWLRAAGDVAGVRAHRASYAALLPALQTCSTLLGVVVFIFLPPSLYFGAEEWVAWTPALAVAALVLHLVVLWLALRLLKRAGCGRKERWKTIAPLIVLPPASVHALSVVSQGLYARFDPLALAALCLGDDAFDRLARRREWLFSAARRAAEGSDREPFWTLREQVRRETVAGTGRQVSPARRDDPTAAAYCPLCAAEYRHGFPTCSDCGVDVEAFAETPATEKAAAGHP